MALRLRRRRTGRTGQNTAKKTKQKKPNLNTFGTGLTGQRPSPFPLPLPPPGLYNVGFCIFVLVLLSVPPGYATATAGSSIVTPSDTHSVTHTPTTARCFASWGGKKQKKCVPGPLPLSFYRQVSPHSHWTPGESDCNTLRRFIDLCVTSRQHLLSESEGGQLIFLPFHRHFPLYMSCKIQQLIVPSAV